MCAADGTGERRLTDLNREWKADVTLSAPERFTFFRAGYDIARATAKRSAGRASATGAARTSPIILDWFATRLACDSERR